MTIEETYKSDMRFQNCEDEHYNLHNDGLDEGFRDWDDFYNYMYK